MMMSPTTQTRVAAIAADETNVGQVIKAINNNAQAEFNLVDIIVPSNNLINDVRDAQPSLVLIDYQTGEQSVLDVIDNLISEFPDISIIALLPGSDPLVAQQVTLAGARAFLPRPFTEVNLLSTMRRVVQLHHLRITSRGGEPSPKQKALRTLDVITVFSSQGGVGCSTVATNLAIALQKKTGSEVLLMGGDLFFGQTEVLLNIKTNKTLADLIPHSGQLDETLIRNVVVNHSSGIDVLIEPSDIQMAQGVRPEELLNVIEELKQIYDFVVIDGGNSLNENSITYMDVADRIVFLTIPELGALRNMGKFISLTETLSYEPEKVLYVLNRGGIRGGVKAGDIEKTLNKKFFLEIPDDHPKAMMSLNRGIPVIVNYPGSAMSKATRELAEKMMGMFTK